MTNKIHWRSGLMAINPNETETYDGRIVRTAFNSSNPQRPTLTMSVNREHDGLEKTISFYPWSAADMFGEEIPDEKIFDPIKNLYEDFGISKESELLNRSVKAKYFFDRLVGIQKI